MDLSNFKLKVYIGVHDKTPKMAVYDPEGRYVTMIDQKFDNLQELIDYTVSMTEHKTGQKLNGKFTDLVKKITANLPV